MNGYEKLQATVSAVLPCCHMAWPKGKAPALPWAVFYVDQTEPVGEDGGYCEKVDWIVEVYQRARDATVEKALARALRSEYGAVSKDESWVSDEDCLMTVFRFCDYQEVEDGEEE